MPEGPSIILLKEEALQFKQKKIMAVSGNTKTIDKATLLNKQVIDFKSWGKHFLICMKGFTVKIHFLMFGSYLINSRKNTPVRLNITFNTGEINFYACSVKILEGDIHAHYNWKTDIMSNEWDEKEALKELKANPGMMVCDAFLNQEIFAGVGNIIKNEVLYRIRVHPESILSALPAAKLKELTREARIYSFQFLEWKRNYKLKKHWLAHTKTLCLRCNLPIIKKYLGTTHRRSFFCTNCQKLYV